MSTPKRRRDEDVSDAPLTLREAETSLRGAAALREALEQHSYAIVALDAADALAVRHCAEAGLAYFTSTPEATKRTHRHVFSDAGGAGLCGWLRSRSTSGGQALRHARGLLPEQRSLVEQWPLGVRLGPCAAGATGPVAPAGRHALSPTACC